MAHSIWSHHETFTLWNSLCQRAVPMAVLWIGSLPPNSFNSPNFQTSWSHKRMPMMQRENSPVTQTTPEPTLSSWGGWPREKFPPPLATRQARSYCPACRTTLIATRFWVVMICPIIKCLTVLRVFFYFVWFVFIHHNFQFYFELCTYCDILDIYLS